MNRLFFGRIIQRCRNIVKRSVVSLLLFALSFPLLGDEQKPTAVILAIGVEAYELDHLNKLQYVAEDAIDVVRSISEITNIEVSRSRVVVADRIWKRNDEPLPTEVSGIKVENRPSIKRNDVIDIVESFLRDVDKNTPSRDDPEELVFVYLGGHGDSVDGANVGVSFLPSDFQENFTRDYPISNLIEEHKNGPRLNNTIVILNMCKAGNLPGAQANATSKKELRDRIVRLSDGSEKRHFIPASVGYESTFEWEGRGSLLALSLREVFKYATKPETSKITLGSLWSSLGPELRSIQDEYKEAMGFKRLDLTPVDLSDQLSESSKELVIGRTNEAAAIQNQILGEGLLALATGRDGRTRAELLRLAASNFGKAAKLSNKNLNSNRIWEAFAYGLGEEKARALELMRGAKRDLTDREAIDYLNDFLPTEEKYPIAIVGIQGFSNNQLLYDSQIRAFEEWTSFLSEFTNIKITSEVNFFVPVGDKGTSSTRLITEIDEIKHNAVVLMRENNSVEQVVDAIQSIPEDHHLILIVHGIAGQEGLGNIDPIFDPINVVNSADLIQRDTTLVLDISSGGHYIERLDSVRLPKLSLLASAKQKNGITYRIPPGSNPTFQERSTTHILLETIGRGLNERTSLEQFNQRHADMFEKLNLSKFEPGQILWEPSPRLDIHPFENLHSGVLDFADLLDLYRFWPAVKLERGISVLSNKDSLDKMRVLSTSLVGQPDEALVEYVNKLDSFDFDEFHLIDGLKHLKAGAISELLSEPGAGTVLGSAFGNYERALRKFEEVAGLVVDDDIHQSIMTKVGEELLIATEKRMDEKIESGVIRPLQIIISEYVSPQIPDLGPVCMGAGRLISSLGQQSTRGDIELARENQLSEISPGISVCPGDVSAIQGTNKHAVFQVLKWLSDSSGDADLLVVVLSGRGAMFGIEPVVILEEADPVGRELRFKEDGSVPVPPSADLFDSDHYVKLSEILDLLRDRKTLFLLDTKFEPAGWSRPDLKTRFVFPTHSFAWYESIERTNVVNKYPENHLIVWPELRIVDNRHLNEYGHDVMLSPFLEGLFGGENGLSTTTTYQAWVDSSFVGSDGVSGIALSGQSHRFALAAGGGVEELSNILSERILERMWAVGIMTLLKNTRATGALENTSTAVLYCMAKDLDENISSERPAEVGEAIAELRSLSRVNLTSEFLTSYLFWIKYVFDDCLQEPEVALDLYSNVLELGKFPSDKSDLLYELAQNTANKLVRLRMNKLTKALSSMEVSSEELRNLIPRIRELSE